VRPGELACHVDFAYRLFEEPGGKPVQLEIEAVGIFYGLQSFLGDLGSRRAIFSNIPRREGIGRPIECTLKKNQRLLESFGKPDNGKMFG
jgi:hypothetical protein